MPDAGVLTPPDPRPGIGVTTTVAPDILFDAAGPSGGGRDRGRRIDDALERAGLAGIDRRPVRAYSLGMRQRLGLAAALLQFGRWFLDQLTSGGLTSLLDTPDDELAEAGNGTGEVRAWSRSPGATRGRAAKRLAYEPIHEWINGMGVAMYKTARVSARTVR